MFFFGPRRLLKVIGTATLLIIMPVGFIGLGIMGRQMAGVLLKKGVDLVVWNRTMKATEPLVAMGARAAKSPAEVVDECETTHAMVPPPAKSRP